MTAQEQKTELTKEIKTQLKPLKVPVEIIPYIDQFIKECNLHQLKNLVNNMTELKKFIKQSLLQHKFN